MASIPSLNTLALPLEDRELLDKQLLQSRAAFRAEIRRVLACKNKKQKQALWEDWKIKYGDRPAYIKELVNVAQSLQTKFDIANWKLQGE